MLADLCRLLRVQTENNAGNRISPGPAFRLPTGKTASSVATGLHCESSQFPG